MHISAAFDSGNIQVLDASDASNIQLKIRKDAGGEHMQWFHFRVTGCRDQAMVLRLNNAKEASYPKAWAGYQAVGSSDRESWVRVDTEYQDGCLVIRDTPVHDTMWYAYFAPYSYERHLDLVAACQERGAQIEVLGDTLDGASLDLVTIGEGPRKIWIIARQHPGESMAEWWMEGFLDRLLDEDDALSRELKERATFYLVPNMNPDGSRRGHLRTNSCGANLNREWHDPTLERSPEVKVVRDRMDQTGVDLCLDVHGDEELPYNFIAGSEAIEGWTDRLAGLLEHFLSAFKIATPDFQTEYGYPVNDPGKANMTMCTNQIAERFDCLAMTLEQPFKDTANSPQPIWGWSPSRAAALGRSILHPIAAVLPDLR